MFGDPAAAQPFPESNNGLIIGAFVTGKSFNSKSVSLCLAFCNSDFFCFGVGSRHQNLSSCSRNNKMKQKYCLWAGAQENEQNDKLDVVKSLGITIAAVSMCGDVLRGRMLMHAHQIGENLVLVPAERLVASETRSLPHPKRYHCPLLPLPG
jgi:hypothetical protein